MDLSISHLVERHRLSLAQIDRLKWAEVDRIDLLEEKFDALSQVNQIRKILDQLEESGIFFICIKGFALSQRIYEDPTIRFSRDLDILVPDEKEVQILRKRLLDIGWLSVDDYWVAEMPRQSWYMNIAMETELVDPSSGIHLEIHWVLDHLIFNLGEEGSKDLLFSNIQKSHLLGRSVNVLSPELELTYLLIHGAKHAWFRLKWLVDIHHYPFQLINQRKFQELFLRLKLQGIIAQTDELLKTYFGNGLSFQINEKSNSFLVQYANQQIKGVVLEGSPNAFQFTNYLIYNWLITPNKKIAIKMLFRTIGIRPQDISQVKLNAYWMYFFYRYYSLFTRKVLIMKS